MSALLTLTAAMAGTAFDCDVVSRHFTVFAPSAEATSAHKGNILTLYRLEAEGEGFGEGMRIDNVFDGLPESLFVSLDDGSGSPTEITIFELDHSKGTARASITENLTPSSATKTMIGLEGSCSFMPSGEGAQ